ncbi:MAG: pilus assembly protein [Chloroflexi bacterium]|nr:pilus assembly protein [Chloroflexota bacterium]
MKRLIKSLGYQTGVTVIEFAIIAPLLFFLIFGIIEGGRVFSAWLVITNEAREGARFGVVRYGDPVRGPTLVGDTKAHVEDRVSSQLDPSNMSVSVQLTGDPAVAVIVNYQVEIATPLIQSVFPNPFPLTAKSVMRAEK